MYPYDEDNNLNNDNNDNVNSDAVNNVNNDAVNNASSENANSAPQDSSDGTYRIVKPDAGRNYGDNECYRDANYTRDTGSTGYYSPTPNPNSVPKPKKPRKPHHGMSAGAIVALCLVCALIGGCAGGVLLYAFSDNGESTTAPTLTQEPAPQQTASSIASDSTTMSGRDIYYNLALKQVVGINTDITTTNIWGMAVQGSVRGSGFVISEDGYILTNYHVIEDAYETGSPITVLFSEESGYETTEYTAEIVGFDRNNDVAVIKIDASGLSAATLGSTDDLLVGDTVYAVGNPLGELNYSMSEGIVSATDRQITTSEGTANMFQITAAVNEGNSGGPVYNEYGQVVGIVTARPNDEGAQGIGFAVPIDDAVRIADRVIDNDMNSDPNAVPAYLGIEPRDVSEDAMEYYNWPRGAFVFAVTSGSAAEQAGIKAGDIITSVNGYNVYSSDDLREELTYYSAGDTTTITVYRSGEYIDLSVTFGAAPEDNSTQSYVSVPWLQDSAA